MALKQKSLTYRDILGQIRKKELAPFYLLQGEEPYYLDLIADAFENNVIDEDDRDFNLSVLYGADTQLDEITTASKQYPFMADRRLVLVKEMQAMQRGKAELESLAPYVRNPNDSTVLVIVFKGEPLKASSPLIKAAAEGGGVVFTSNRLRDYQLMTPIRDYAASKKIGIDDDAVEMLAAMIGNDLSQLFREIDKMTVAAGSNRNRITSAMIRHLTGMSKEFAPYELAGAVASRDFWKCMVIISQAARNPVKNPALMMIPSIFRLFQNLCIVHRLQDKSEMSISVAVGAKNIYAVRELKDAMSKYSLAQCLRAISAIREFDCNSKGIRSQQKEHELLKELIFRIMS